MPEPHRHSYVALVAALRSEFNPLALEAMNIQLVEHRYATSSIGVLAQAVRDAADVAYDAGERADRECTHSAGCPIHPDTDGLHNFDVQLSTANQTVHTNR